MAHELFSEEELGNHLQELMEKGRPEPLRRKRNVELTLEDYTKAKKYTSPFVRQLSEQINKTFHAWMDARKQNSFTVFEKDLDALIELKKEESEILGYQDHPYNALLNEYEKGATVALIDKTFENLLTSVKKLVG